jgi:hypothetical protein
MLPFKREAFLGHSIVGLARTIYTVCIRYFWQGNYQIYGHIWCVYLRFWPTLLMCNHVYP